MTNYRLKSGTQAFTHQGMVVSGGRLYTEDSSAVITYPGRFEKVAEQPEVPEPHQDFQKGGVVEDMSIFSEPDADYTN